MVLLVVDEMDALRSARHVLYDLFEWASAKESTLVLIGIANTMDLMENHLTKLSSLQCRPQVCVFQAYTHQQLVTILTTRLRASSVNPDDVFDPNAVELLARKVKTRSGDAREFLEASW